MGASSCVFCKIIRGEILGAVVLDEPDTLVFLDHSPLFHGHCLVVPKTHYGTLVDVPPSEVGPLFVCAQRVARAVESAMAADGFFVAVNNRISQSVPHVHIHVIPRRKKDGLKGFFWPRARYADDEAEERVRKAIADAIVGGGAPPGS